MASQKYWLMKTEPHVFSFDDLAKAAERRTSWEGVRNYQARNFMRDQFKNGDLALVYHSNTDVPGIVGVAKVVKEAYEDESAKDKQSPYFDDRAKEKNPWVRVDIEAVAKFSEIITRDHIRLEKKLATMWVLRPGSRLSIQPVSEGEYKVLCKLRKLIYL